MGRIIIISIVRGIVHRDRNMTLLDIRLFENDIEATGMYFQILIFQYYIQLYFAHFNLN